MAQTHEPGDGEEFTPAPGAGPGPEQQHERDHGYEAYEAEPGTDAEETTAARAQGQPPGAPYGGPATPGRGIAAALGTLGDGRYRLTHRLGRGGMAEVLAAQDVRLGRQVAVKLLRPELAQDEVARLRFTREAHSVASLNHHSIVAVYDTGEELVGGESTPYIVMELVEGRTVRELLLAEEAPPVDQALIIIAGVLEALDYSHRHGIVHRDIKPANVIITTTGAVKVMDFGIARALTGAATTMTQTGMVMGTPQYLSPEQALGKPVDHRSDLYAAGCMLYELLTLRPPFTGDTPLSVVYQHVQDAPVPPAQANSRVPWQLDELVLRSLAKNPDDRFQSADEFRAHLQHALREMHGGAGGYPTAVLGGYDGTPGQGTAVTTMLGASALPPNDRTTVLPYGAAATGYQTPQAPYGGAGGGGGRPGGGGYGGGYQDEPQPAGGRRKALAWAAGVVLVLAAGIGVAVAASGGGTSGGSNSIPPQPNSSVSAPDSTSDTQTTPTPSPSPSPSQSRSRSTYQPPTDSGQVPPSQPSYRPTRSSSPSGSPSGTASASTSSSASASTSASASSTASSGSGSGSSPSGQPSGGSSSQPTGSSHPPVIGTIGGTGPGGGIGQN
ncbi:protein kinase domain-containing protein [Kitasatospora sp. NBC_01266]|uniref:protein kinase domain-containing protein n=1 Tax=Kitasatospora sp. NBC_01266 TaxID=2903572 RepID=UPI002E2F5EF8|nr:protein kinase [Kitasatospora sp. NBC_01266]